MADLAGSGPEPASVGLRYGGLGLRVESDDAGHLDWLREFLTPAFEAVAPPSLARVIRVRIDPARYAAALDRGPDEGSVPCFWTDTGVHRLPAWTAATAGERLLFDSAARAFYRLNGAAAIEILTSGESRSVRDALMRVVRELATIDLRRAGGLVLHAATLAVGDRVLLVAGPKGAGKTTLLVHLLRGPRTRFVSNDRAAILAGGPAPEVRGLPTIVKLLRTSTAWFPGLDQRLDLNRYHHHLTLAEAESRPASPSPRPPRQAFSLSPAQFCQVLGTTPAPGGRLAAILFPQRADAGATTLRRLASVEATTAIGAAQLGSLLAQARGAPEATSADPWTPDGPLSAEAAAQTMARCGELAAVVPAYACDVGPEAYADPAAADRFLSDIGLSAWTCRFSSRPWTGQLCSRGRWTASGR